MREKLVDISSLLPRIMPQVIGCMKTLAMDALQHAAVDFCTESGVWCAAFQEDVLEGESVIALTSMRTTRLVGLHSLYIDGQKQGQDTFSVTPTDIILNFTPTTCGTATVDGFVRPLRTAVQLPSFLVEEWGDILTYGALAKLKSMSGPNITWTDSGGASLNNDLYTEGCYRAKARIFRNRHGGGALYLRSGE